MVGVFQKNMPLPDDPSPKCLNILVRWLSIPPPPPLSLPCYSYNCACPNILPTYIVHVNTVMKIIHCCIEHILRLDDVPITRKHNTIIILFVHDIFNVSLSKRFKTCIGDCTVKPISPWKLLIHGFKTFIFENVNQFHVIICP